MEQPNHRAALPGICKKAPEIKTRFARAFLLFAFG